MFDINILINSQAVEKDRLLSVLENTPTHILGARISISKVRGRTLRVAVDRARARIPSRNFALIAA